MTRKKKVLKAFIVMPFNKEPIEKIYSDVIKPTLTKHEFESSRVDEMSGSKTIVEDIHNGIDGSSLVVAITTGSNANVFYELGYAKHAGKEVILICDDTKTIPSDVHHIRHLIYDPSNMPKLKKDFDRWVSESDVSSIPKVRKKFASDEIMHRGDIFPDIIDAALFMAPIQGQDMRTDIIGHIKNGQVIPSRYLYLGDQGYRNWLKLCQDPEYIYFKDAVNFYTNNSKRLSDTIFNTLGEASFDFISLGPGNGQKDLVLLRAFAKNLSSDNHLYYYPYDINTLMIEESIRTIAADRTVKNCTKIKAIASDFESLPRFKPVYQYRAEPNVFSLVGNTLGNMEKDHAFLTQLYKTAMLENDILILEVRILSDKKVIGSVEVNKVFDFGPLDALGVPYDSNKLTYNTEEKSISNIPGTETTVAIYEEVDIAGKKYNPVQLSYIHLYSPEKLENVLKNVGFEIIDSFTNSSFAIFMLHKTKK
jgi:hypothetical protein